MTSPWTECPPWCRVDHGAHVDCPHEGRHAWLDSRLDGVTTSVSLLAFADPEETPSPTLICLRLRQRDLADKDSVEMTAEEARHLAGLLVEAAARADVSTYDAMNATTPAQRPPRSTPIAS
jgi:hypothetical protein